MPFGRKAGPTMVYEYRAYAPTVGQESVETEMRARTRLWNALVEIDRDYRARARDLTGEQLWGAAITARPEIAPMLDLLDVQRRQRVHEACSASGLHWCDSDDVRVNYEQAIARHRPLWYQRKGNDDAVVWAPRDLRFHSSRLGGKLVLRVQKVPRRFTMPSAESDGRHTPESQIEMMVGRDGAPVRFAARIHRDLPADAVIKRAELLMEVVGYHERWKLVLVVGTENAVGATSPNPLRVAVDVGWRQHASGLLVASWQGSDGRSGQLVLPQANLIAGFERADDLASVRKQHFLAAQAVLVEHQESLALPEELRADLETLAQWESPYRLARFADRWYRDGSGVGEIYELIQAWERREHHLADEQNNRRRRSMAHRTWLYGNFAAQLCRDYGEIVIEKLDLRKLAMMKNEEPWSDARHHRVIAAISELRLRLSSTARRTGVSIVEVKAGLTTGEMIQVAA